jgi:hypothetical protein
MRLSRFRLGPSGNLSAHFSWYQDFADTRAFLAPEIFWYHPASWEREIFGNVFQSDKWCEGSLWKEINAWVSDHYGIAIRIRVA